MAPRIGRPKIPKPDRAGSLLGIRLTVAERRDLDTAARKAGTSLSTWARNVLLAAAQPTAEGGRMMTTNGVPHGARTTEVEGRTYWMECTRGEPRPQVVVVDADSGEPQGYFYPVRPGFPHVAHQPAESGNTRQADIVGVIANRFSHGI